MAAALAGPPARCGSRPVHAAAGAVTEREIRRTGRRGGLPAVDAVRGGLPGTAAGPVAPNQRLWIRIGYRTYDCPELGPWRLQHSGITARRGLWEVHYDPYDATQVFV